MAPIALASEHLRVECDPAQGFVILSIVDVATGADALWTRRTHAAAACSRNLGPSGEASIETFLDVFVGGWFGMFPAVGYPAREDPTSLLHGELVRLPWDVIEATPTKVEAQVRAVRGPFAVTRRLHVAERGLQVDERIEHVGREPATYLWGHHPCFSRATFAGGRIELDALAASVPDPPFDPRAAVLRPLDGLAWPMAENRDGDPIDISSIPAEPDGRVDHVVIRPASGRIRLTAPVHDLALVLDFDLAHFPYVLLWENFEARGGWPFWRDVDTFGIEPSSNPGRSVPDAQLAGAVRMLRPGEVLSTTITARWTPLRDWMTPERQKGRP